MGGALALALSRRGFRIDALVYRSRRGISTLASEIRPAPALVSSAKILAIESPIVLVTTQDNELQDTALLLRDKVKKAAVIFHTSGSISSEILSDLRSNGCHVGSIHPLASISGWRDGPRRFAGAFFCLEGDAASVRVGKKLVSALGGRSFSIKTANKPLYHAAALTAAGRSL